MGRESRIWAFTFKRWSSFRYDDGVWSWGELIFIKLNNVLLDTKPVRDGTRFEPKSSIRCHFLLLS